jgi:2-phospho-L-lactate transferase/gluconeogenesis factor (CofD/UPF0052 family)
VAVLGRGRGLGTVLRALRARGVRLDAIVASARPAGFDASQDAASAPDVTELRRSLQALTDDRVALSRALRRPLMIDRLGRHPLGDLLLGSLAAAFGDLAEASTWLGEQLGIDGSVLPVTTEPLMYAIDDGRLRFSPERPVVSPAVTGAVRDARLVLLAPGDLFAGVLAAAAVPAVAGALVGARGRVVWIANLAPASETLSDQLSTIRRHGVRVDAVLCDPRAPLCAADPAGGRLVADGVVLIPRSLCGPKADAHDRELLGDALTELLGTARYQHA